VFTHCWCCLAWLRCSDFPVCSLVYVLRLRVHNCPLPTPPSNSLHASGGSVFLNLLGAAKGALIRAAGSTQTLGRNDYIVDMSKMQSSVHVQEPAARLRYGRRRKRLAR